MAFIHDAFRVWALPHPPFDFPSTIGSPITVFWCFSPSQFGFLVLSPSQFGLSVYVGVAASYCC